MGANKDRGILTESYTQFYFITITIDDPGDRSKLMCLLLGDVGSL